MKIAKVLWLMALMAPSVGLAEPPTTPTPTAALTQLVAGSRWAWWDGNFDRYTRGRMKDWVEFYKDGTARVPWRDHAQYWTMNESNVLTLSDSGTNGDKHIFTMDLSNKSGSTENQNLHIRYERRATKPAMWK
jgi:hypothetical protein